MTKENEQGGSNKPPNTPFRQQRLKAWQPLLTPRPVILTFIVVGIIFIPIGIGMVVSSNEVVEAIVQYDEICDVGKVCNITIEVPADMKAPVYMYYRLDNFFQNHRRYVKSRNDNQLRGKPVKIYDDILDCEPYAVRNDIREPDFFYFPCGLIAKSQFNDTFALWNGTKPIPLRKNGIAWGSDREKKFRNPPPFTPGIRTVPDIEDEDFIVWMKTAGLPDFLKLYRIIEQDIPKGTYTVTVTSRYPVHSFKGKKYVVLSTTTWVGGKNPFIGYAYIVVGVISFIQGVLFLVKHKIAPRKLGDITYLEWHK